MLTLPANAAIHHEKHNSSTSSSYAADILAHFNSNGEEVWQNNASLRELNDKGFSTEWIANSWVRVSYGEKAAERSISKTQTAMHILQADSAFDHIQNNETILLPEDFQIQDRLQRAAFMRGIGHAWRNAVPFDNPNWNLPAEADTSLSSPMTVAVVDTGVDYTHPLLAKNLWQNKGEMGLDPHNQPKETNGIDDDINGFVDDVIGWDFVGADNKPYDLIQNLPQILNGEGNPGHGTHIAGGLGSNTKIMALRVISDRGTGLTSDVMRAIDYAIHQKANVITQFWQSQSANNVALQDILHSAAAANILVVSTQNGRSLDANGGCHAEAKDSAKPEDQDSSAICVGQSEHTAQAPADIYVSGSAVPSTMVKNNFSAKIFDLAGFAMDWHGPTAAAQKVLAAVANIWDSRPKHSWHDIKHQLLSFFRKSENTANAKLNDTTESSTEPTAKVQQ